jgi:pre-mRNA-splicing factor SYF2
LAFSLGLERGEQQPPADVATAAGTSDAVEQQQLEDNDADGQEGAAADDGYPQMTEKQKKLFELRLKMVRRVILPTLLQGCCHAV